MQCTATLRAALAGLHARTSGDRSSWLTLAMSWLMFAVACSAARSLVRSSSARTWSVTSSPQAAAAKMAPVSGSRTGVEEMRIRPALQAQRGEEGGRQTKSGRDIVGLGV